MNIIPLGMNCEIATHIVRSGLVSSKKGGRKTLPFDLMLTNYYGICEMFGSENSLDTFLNINISQNEISKQYKNGLFSYSDAANAPYGSMIVNSELGFIFNHESPGHPSLHHIENWTSKDMFCENNFEKFKERYTKRYNNMLRQIEEGDVTFVISGFVWPSKLEQVIAKKFPNLNFKLCVYKPGGNMRNFLYNSEIYFKNYKMLCEKYDDTSLDNFEVGFQKGRIRYISLNSYWYK